MTNQQPAVEPQAHEFIPSFLNGTLCATCKSTRGKSWHADSPDPQERGGATVPAGTHITMAMPPHNHSGLVRCAEGCPGWTDRGGATVDLEQRFDVMRRREIEDPQTWKAANRDLYELAKDALAQLAERDERLELMRVVCDAARVIPKCVRMNNAIHEDHSCLAALNEALDDLDQAQPRQETPKDA